MRWSTSAEHAWTTCMQAGAKGAAGKGAVRVHEALWQELDSCMKLLHSTVVLVWHLQRVLNKKRDPLTLASFVDVVQVRHYRTGTKY